MKEIEILVYVDEKSRAHRHMAAPEVTFEEILVKLRTDGIILEEMVVVEEDCEEDLDLSQQVGSRGHHRRILHCHRCRHVHVTIQHPGTNPPDPLEHSFRSGKTVGSLLTWAIDQIPGIDKTAKWCLRDAHGEIIDPDVHIGRLASHPGCCLEVSLTEHEKPKG